MRKKKKKQIYMEGKEKSLGWANYRQNRWELEGGIDKSMLFFSDKFFCHDNIKQIEQFKKE